LNSDDRDSKGQKSIPETGSRLCRRWKISVALSLKTTLELMSKLKLYG